ncbi:hypothetical protein ACFVWG_17880 [Kribbella sp. NPDC058245]|uniref:hypothetical protein n=1 Tax=Kribbella sp. NPDC058245 TaxID=3346399 RepID=UPI0036EA242F
MTAPVSAAGRTGRGGIRREVVAALAITTTVGYGVLYYAFSALLEPMRTDLHISTTTATGALTTSALTSAGATAPLAAAALISAVGYTPLILTAAGGCLLASLAFVAAHHLPSPSERQGLASDT